MNYIVKSILLLYAAADMVAARSLDYGHLVMLLLIVAATIVKEKFIDANPITAAALLLIAGGMIIDWRFALLLGLPLYDFVLKRSPIGIAVSVVPLLPVMAAGMPLHAAVCLALAALCGLLAYTQRKAGAEQRRLTDTLDTERRLRYELEQTKMKLLRSSKEIASITEVRERNRIAREIHDTVGHSIAGILIQLQAAYKLHAKDEAKAMGLVRKSIEGLAGSVDLLRETVHNIKPRDNLGVEFLRSIVDNFGFCPIQLKLNGDFNAIPANHLEIISTNMKEALTNAARYSQATLVDITVDVNDQYSRLYVKDNGIGCAQVKEGLGLSGMRERVGNLGGTASFSSNDGFLIVCVIPRTERGIGYESTDR